MEWITLIAANWDTVLLAATSLVTAASIIVRVTPTKKDDEAVSKIMKFLNLLAINKPVEKKD